MQLRPADFWRLTLAEWRGALAGYADRLSLTRNQQAWEVSHLLVAAGCEPEAVTPAKLLGKKERKRRPKAQAVEGEKMPVDEFYRLIQAENARVKDGTV